MKRKQWLISWIGSTDLTASEKKNTEDKGPVFGALQESVRFDRVCLLTNYPHERSAKFCNWLESERPQYRDLIGLQEIDLVSPIHYASIYSEVSKHLKALRLPSDDVDLTFHLSPGTPAMSAIWIMLAKTRFPAKLIQTSKEQGFESVDFNFDLATDFLPEYLQRGGERMDRLASRPLESVPNFEKILHKSAVVNEQIKLAQRIAPYDVPVLILGETGTGKELFAEAIKASSLRSKKPFITVNCGAIAPELANSELFGHVRGAFTDAKGDRKGHFREADGGTLFLDEIGDLPLNTQVRLLRALQAKEITPLGESKAILVDVRVIAATHRDLAAEVVLGRFREDLYHRLAVGILKLPPLREREGDVDLLVDEFLKKINDDAMGKPEAQLKTISPGARKVLLAHHWPGNIRELYHSLLRAAIWSAGEVIQADDVRSALLPVQRQDDEVMGRSLGEGFDLRMLLNEVSGKYILRALEQTGQRRASAAKLLGFKNHQTLTNWMERLRLGSQQSTLSNGE